MNENKKRCEIPPENKRDTTADKKKIKKAFKIILCVFLALGLLLGTLALVTDLLKQSEEEYSYDDFRFFEPDYNSNLLENKMYTSLNRSIYFDRYGSEIVLTEENSAENAASGLFYSYFQCLVNGDYESYPAFFSDKYLKENPDKIPERFTMQGVYDIHVKLHSVTKPQADNDDLSAEIYEVSYRIFENNGTFRRDILPDETRTLVFELYIYKNGAKINSIASRANA